MEEKPSDVMPCRFAQIEMTIRIVKDVVTVEWSSGGDAYPSRTPQKQALA